MGTDIKPHALEFNCEKLCIDEVFHFSRYVLEVLEILRMLEYIDSWFIFGVSTDTTI